MKLFETTVNDKIYFICAKDIKRAKELTKTGTTKEIHIEEYENYFISGHVNNVTNPTLKTCFDYDKSERVIFSFTRTY